MRAPALLTLQLLNVLVGGGQYLGFATATGIWTAGGWSEVQIGLAMTAANLCYAACVAQGGRLSDRWGRGRTAILGGAVCAVAAAIALVLGTPLSALAAVMLGCAGSAFFFPGNVGLFSDARAPEGAPNLPLHVKVSRYNLGWSGGNIAGFGLAWAFATLPPRLGWVTVLVGMIVVVAVLWPCRALPAHPPQVAGDRSPHPALPRLMWMGRAALLVYCLMGMALISLITRSLKGQGLDADAAKSAGNAALFAYAIGYFLTFVLLGAWSGWVLRPWRLLVLQLPVLAAALGFLALGHGGVPPTAALAGLGLLLGIGFGAVYTGSIYYSMRLPEGAARAAALHETALGIGSTAGPIACGAWMSASGQGGLGGLATWLVAVAAAVLALQIALIPGAVRRGAR